MSELSKESIEQALAAYVDPHQEKDLVSTKCVKDIRIDGGKVAVDVVLGYPAAGFKAELKSALQSRLLEAGATEAEVKVSWNIQAHSVQRRVRRIQRSSVRPVIRAAIAKA